MAINETLDNQRKQTEQFRRWTIWEKSTTQRVRCCECSGWNNEIPTAETEFLKIGVMFFLGCEGKKMEMRNPDLKEVNISEFMMPSYFILFLAGIHQPVFFRKSIVGDKIIFIMKKFREILVNQILDNCFIQLDRLLVAGCLVTSDSNSGSRPLVLHRWEDLTLKTLYQRSCWDIFIRHKKSL